MNRREVRNTHLVFAIALFLLAIHSLDSIRSSAETQGRISSPIDDSKIVPLAGNVHPLAQSRFDLGPVRTDTAARRLMPILKRSAQQERELGSFLDSLQDSASPNFREFLTPEQFGEQYGISEQDLETVESWLRQHGFAIGHVSKGRTAIEFSGTVGQLQ